jgi:sec-independent protein translocase protein TatA
MAGVCRREFFMGPIGIPELLVILFLVVLIFGASRLPELGKGLGKGIRNFKEATREGSDDKEK